MIAARTRRLAIAKMPRRSSTTTVIATVPSLLAGASAGRRRAVICRGLRRCRSWNSSRHRDARQSWTPLPAQAVKKTHSTSAFWLEAQTSSSRDLRDEASPRTHPRGSRAGRSTLVGARPARSRSPSLPISHGRHGGRAAASPRGLRYYTRGAKRSYLGCTSSAASARPRHAASGPRCVRHAFPTAVSSCTPCRRLPDAALPRC